MSTDLQKNTEDVGVDIHWHAIDFELNGQKLPHPAPVPYRGPAA